MLHKKRHMIWLVVIVSLGAAVFLLLPNLLNQEPPPPRLSDNLAGVIVMSPAVELPDFELRDQNNQPVNEEAFENRWTLAFFGYTHCPDVCPNAMFVMNSISRRDDIPTDTRYAFFSVDPNRDTPERLKDFVEYFNPNFVGITGEKSEIDKVAEKLGVIYDFEGDTNDGDYLVNHFAAIYLIDPEARVRGYILPPHDNARVSQAYLEIRKHYQE